MKKELLGIVIILAMLSLFFQPSVTGFITRSISNTQDNKDTMICNSNGNCWEPTAANIQVAIDDLGAQGGTVWLPPKVYTLTQDKVFIRNNIRLTGSGIGSTILKKADGTSGYPLWAEYVENFTISDLTIDGNRHAGAQGNGLMVRASENFIIENVHIKSPSGGGLGIIRSENGFISKVLVNDVGQWQGIGGLQSTNIVFSDCIVWNVTQDFGAAFSGVQNSTVNNLIVYDSNYGIKVDDDDANTMLTENTEFNNIHVSVTGTGDGLKLLQQKNNNYNNVFVSGGQTGLRVWPTVSNINMNNIHVEDSITRGIMIEGNKIQMNNVLIKNPGTYGLSLVSGENIGLTSIKVETPGSENRIVDSSNVLISESSFSEGGAYGLRISNSQDVIVKNSLMKNNVLEGILVDGSSGSVSNFMLSDNIVTENSKGIAVTDHAHENYIITNNVLTSNSGQALDDKGTGSNKLVEDNLT